MGQAVETDELGWPAGLWDAAQDRLMEAAREVICAGAVEPDRERAERAAAAVEAARSLEGKGLKVASARALAETGSPLSPALSRGACMRAGMGEVASALAAAIVRGVDDALAGGGRLGPSVGLAGREPDIVGCTTGDEVAAVVGGEDGEASLVVAEPVDSTDTISGLEAAVSVWAPDASGRLALVDGGSYAYTDAEGALAAACGADGWVPGAVGAGWHQSVPVPMDLAHAAIEGDRESIAALIDHLPEGLGPQDAAEWSAQGMRAADGIEVEEAADDLASIVSRSTDAARGGSEPATHDMGRSNDEGYAVA